MQDVTFNWEEAPDSLVAGAESGYALSVNGTERTATLTLKNVRITNEISVPNDIYTLKIKLIGNNEIANITGNAFYYCDILRAEEAEGTAKLTIKDLTHYFNAGKLTVGANTDVLINSKLNFTSSGEVGGEIEIDGKLTVDTDSVEESVARSLNVTEGAVITVGKCSIGTGGSLIVNGSKTQYGLKLTGPQYSNNTYSLKEVLTIAEGGSLSVKGADKAILFSKTMSNQSQKPSLDILNEDGVHLNVESAFNMPTGYLGSKYGTYGTLEVQQNNDDGQVVYEFTPLIQEWVAMGYFTLGTGKEIIPAKEVNIPVDGWNADQTPTSSGGSKTKFYDVFTEAENGTIEVEGSVVRLASHIYARRGAELTLTPKAADGYKLTAFYVDGEAIDMSTAASYKFNIYKDTTVKAEFEKTQEQLIKEARNYAGSVKLIAKSELVKRTNGKKAVKVYWYEKTGKKLYFDGYEIYRSVKKSEYGKKPIFTTKKLQYLNTAVEKGTRYYYKVRGYNEFGSVKIFSDWSTQAWRKVR